MLFAKLNMRSPQLFGFLTLSLSLSDSSDDKLLALLVTLTLETLVATLAVEGAIFFIVFGFGPARELHTCSRFSSLHNRKK